MPLATGISAIGIAASLVASVSGVAGDLEWALPNPLPPASSMTPPVATAEPGWSRSRPTYLTHQVQAQDAVEVGESLELGARGHAGLVLQVV